MIKPIKAILVLLVAIFIATACPASAANGVVFEYPELDQVMQKDDRENIRGYFVAAPDEIAEAKISFDGFVWRDLAQDTSINDGYYHFDYGWMVAGKGKFFIIASATTLDGKILEDRLRVEVEVPPGREDPSVKELLEDIYAEQERRRQAELEEQPVASIGILALNYIEKDWGSYLADNYLMFVPGPTQYEFLLGTYSQAINFVKNYPAGMDILMFIIQPYLFLVSVILGWFLIVTNLGRFNEKLKYWLSRLSAEKETTFSGIVFDMSDLHKVALAEVALKNNQTGYSTRVITDEDGRFGANLEHGDYSYEIEKNNYRNFVDAGDEIESFLGFPVAKGPMHVNASNAYALPTMSLLSQSRWYRHVKIGWSYQIKRVILNNITAIVSIGYLGTILWLMFVDDARVWIYLSLLTIAYLFYWLLERMSQSSGVVYLPGGRKASLVNLILKKNDQNILSVWTNHEGKYRLGVVPDGRYTIYVKDDQYEINPNNGHYAGEEFVIDTHNSCILPINITLREKTTK